ncbi:hypothetical protein B0H10DRAFT_356733 [Mycena sp. CBHHK59/15]|nr:hypothetical protein B0H10DRAFT_356733 [Mycena sp. CBHHK59/15]
MDQMPMVKCSMNMLWNTRIADTCIVFRSWHVSSKATLAASCFAIMALCLLRIPTDCPEDARHPYRLIVGCGGQDKGHSSTTSIDFESAEDAEDAGLLTRRSVVKVAPAGALWYDRLSFFLMLVFMTYNAYLIFAVVLGAAIGHFVCGWKIDVDALLTEQGKVIARCLSCLWATRIHQTWTQ